MAQFEIKGISLEGIAASVPKSTKSNWELDSFSKEELTALINATGIENRRVSDPSINSYELSIVAAENLIRELDWKKEEIELLIFVTQTPSYSIPGTSMILQANLGLSNTCACIDINQGCAGYVYGLSVAASMMSAGNLNKGLLIVSDTITKTINPNNKGLVPIFSDAGSCTALRFDKDINKTVFFNLQTDGTGYDQIIIPSSGYGNENLPSDIPKESNLFMNGQDIFRFGLREVANNVETLLKTFGKTKNDIDHFVMHQANMLLNESIRRKLGFEEEQTPYSLKNYGNTSCASIPVTMASAAQGKPLNGNYLLAGFGVGLSWGSVLANLENTICPEIYEC